MSKILVMPSNKDQIKNLLNDVDGFILGLKKLSVNMPSYYDIDEIIELNDFLEKEGKELFIAINKNIHNEELDYLKEMLNKIDSLNVKAILYYDVALVNLKEELNLKTDLVFSEEHAVTNYATINYWNNMGVKYAYLSNELTINEIKEISENANSKLLVCAFGYIPIFNSERKLIDNYFKTFKLDSKSDKFYIEKEDKKYRIIEKNNITEVYSDYILNAIKELKELDNISYLVFNSFDINEEKFEYFIKSYKFLDEKDIVKLLENVDKGFLYKEMIYKVKKYEK